MPRNIYKPEPNSPHHLYNISTGALFTDDKANGILRKTTDIPSFAVRKKAAENAWYIEFKYRSRGKNIGEEHWVWVKDTNSVRHLLNNNPAANNPSFDPNVKPPKKEKAYPRYIEKRLPRDFSAKRQSIKKLLEKQHTQVIPDTLDDETIIKLIADASSLKPSFLKMEEDSWKLLVRSALRGKNVMMLGDKGEGKTMAVHALKNALGRPFFSFDFGNMQDAQTALIGKTHLDMKTGTWFNESEFVKAIQTKNAIILLDEISRASDDASNILFPILDENQRHLRINEAENIRTIEVAEGVCFVSTANIGFQYTGTRKLDAAFFDRWVKIEVDQLSKSDRKDILRKIFPDLTDYIVDSIAEIADKIRENYISEDPKFTSPFSTRMCITLAELIYDGFSFLAAVEKTVYPEYSNDGGAEGERTFAKQIVQGVYNSTSAQFPFKSQKVVRVQVDSNGKEITGTEIA